MKFKSIKIFIFFYLLCSSASAQEVLVRALLDTNKALIGDQLKLRLLVEKSNNEKKLSFPVFKDTLTDKIEIIKVSPIDTSSETKGKQLLSQELLISVFDTGYFEIPALQFVLDDNGQVEKLSTLPISFEIMPLKADSTIRDIKAIYKMPVGIRDLYPYIIGFIIIIILVWILLYYVKHRKSLVNRQKTVTNKPSDPPYIIALRDLKALNEEKPWTLNKTKYYYSRLSEILRLYIEGQFKTLALEQTTEEILASLKLVLNNVNDLNNLAAILRLSDLVKFAKVLPDSHESAAQIDNAMEFVNNTSSYTETSQEEKKEIVLQKNSIS